MTSLVSPERLDGFGDSRFSGFALERLGTNERRGSDHIHSKITAPLQD